MNAIMRAIRWAHDHDVRFFLGATAAYLLVSCWV